MQRWWKVGCGQCVVLALLCVGGAMYISHLINTNTTMALSEMETSARVLRFIRAHQRLPKSWVDLFYNDPPPNGPDDRRRDENSDARLVHLYKNVDIDVSAVLESVALSKPETFRYVHAKLRDGPARGYYAVEIIQAAAEAMKKQDAAGKSDQVRPAGVESPR